MMYYNDYFSPFPFFFGPIFMIIVWAFIIWGVISIVRHLSQNTKNGNSRAMDILNERYAKGEITKEQLESMKKDLR